MISVHQCERSLQRVRGFLGVLGIGQGISGNPVSGRVPHQQGHEKSMNTAAPGTIPNTILALHYVTSCTEEVALPHLLLLSQLRILHLGTQ